MNIDKVIKIARIIRKSPVKTVLCRVMLIFLNHNGSHLLFTCCKIRWNSLVALLEQYLDMRSPVEKNTD